jgi:hypothetical protein
MKVVLKEHTFHKMVKKDDLPFSTLHTNPQLGGGANDSNGFAGSKNVFDVAHLRKIKEI